MKRIYTISAAAALVAIPTGVTLGVVYGTKEDDFNYSAKKAVTYGEKFFDSHIKDASSSYAASHILNPFGTSSYNLTYLIRLDQQMDSEHARNIIDIKDGEKFEPIYTQKVQVDNVLNADALEAAFVKANEALGKKIDTFSVDEKNKLGIYIGKDLRTREITASLYKVKGLSDTQKTFMDKYWNDFGSIAQPGFFDKDDPNKFLALFGAQCTLNPSQREYFQFNFDEKMMNDNYHYASMSPSQWHDSHPKSFTWFDNDQNKNHTAIMDIFEKNMLQTYEPILDLRNHKLILVLRAYGMDHTSQARFTLGDQAYNPTGVYTKMIHFDLNTLGNTTDLKTTEVVAGENNRDILKNFLTNVLPKYVKEPLIGPGLDLLGSSVPSLKSFGEKFKKLGNMLQHNRIPDAKMNEIFSNDFLDKLLSKLSVNTMVNGEEFIKAINEFSGEKYTSFWTKLDVLIKLYSNNGGQYNMYQLVSGMNVITQEIFARIMEVYPEIKLFEDDSLVEKILGFLKNNGAVPQDYTLATLMSNPMGELVKILINLGERHVHISYEAAKEILPIIPFDLISKNVDKWAHAFDILTQRNNLSNILKFFGENKAQIEERIVNLVSPDKSDDRWATIREILANTKVTKEMVMSLFKVVKATGLVPKMFDKLLGDTPQAAETWVNMFKTGAAVKIFDFIKLAFDDGLIALSQPASPITLSYTESQYSDDYVMTPSDITKFEAFIDNLYANKTDQKHADIINAIISAAGNLDPHFSTVVVEPAVVADPGVEPATGTPEHDVWNAANVKYQAYLVAKKKYDDYIAEGKKQPYERVTAAEIKAFAKDDSTKQDFVDQVLKLVDQVSTAIHPLTQDDRTKIVELYKALDAQRKGAFKTTSGMTDPTDDQIIAWIKPTTVDPLANQMTFEDLKDCMTLPLNRLSKELGPVVSALIQNINFDAMGLSPEISGVISAFKPVIQRLLPDILNTLMNSRPDTLLQTIMAYEATLSTVPTARNWVTLIKRILFAPSTGLAHAFDMQNRPVIGQDADGNPIKVDTTPRQNFEADLPEILGAIFPSGFASGTATDPDDKSISNQELQRLIPGLLYGFANAEDAVNGFKAIIPSLDTGSILNSESIRGVYNIGTFTGELGILDAKIAIGLQKVLKNGLFALTPNDWKDFVTGISNTLHGGSISIIASKLPTKFADVLNRLKLVITPDTIDQVAGSIYTVLTQKLHDAPALVYDTFIDIINTFGLDFKLQHFGSALSALLKNGIGAVTPYQWTQVLKSFNLSDSVVEIVQKLMWGENYKQHVVESMTTVVATMATPPTKATLVPGAKALSSDKPTYDHLVAVYNTKKHNIDLLLAEWTIHSLEDINAKMSEFVKAYNDILLFNRWIADSNADYAIAHP